MGSKELRAAAERLRRWLRAETAAERIAVYQHAKGALGPQRALREDEKAVIDAYLAEHPADDGGPITEARLLSMAFNSRWYPSMLGPERDAGFKVVAGFDYSNGSVCLHAGQTTFATPIKCRTRGAVRRLCAALGIELKEPQPTE